jgi:YggT family protein
VSSIQSFVVVFVGVYVLVIFAYIITSFVRLPYSLNPVARFLYDVCEPYLRLFRRVLPPVGPLDLSPMVAVIVLIAAEQIVVRLLDRLH